MNTHKKRTVTKTFISSSLDYCAFVWIFHCWKLNNRINKLQERALLIVFRIISRHSMNYFITLHNKNIQLLLGIFKLKNGMLPTSEAYLEPCQTSEMEPLA